MKINLNSVLFLSVLSASFSMHAMAASTVQCSIGIKDDPAPLQYVSVSVANREDDVGDTSTSVLGKNSSYSLSAATMWEGNKMLLSLTINGESDEVDQTGEYFTKAKLKAAEAGDLLFEYSYKDAASGATVELACKVTE